MMTMPWGIGEIMLIDCCFCYQLRGYFAELCNFVAKITLMV